MVLKPKSKHKITSEKYIVNNNELYHSNMNTKYEKV
jgi:hypothetical protein